ncbi:MULTISPECIES: threonine/serine exporter ThrE family protein [unclassified Gordonia (in: high G+C Gram-positive bacteria)]|uniref:threonine/serine ThrE exporter family protein n=1 Tax=unclassified Gordonia (in: high G+C Gram-positive bacteria) TaxID=2657482 RepID=UPI001F0D0755|nr:threonine/serine exporter family protein [Gordonia sp. ABSL49_1]MCH5645242.1 threonine/serine exporter family protein [Gordonia sp. ABSL49_1]
MREYIGSALRRLTGTSQATIDTIEPGSIMVSPRKPIDRFDVAAITEVLDLATKIGAVLLDSGTAAIDTQSQIKFVAGAYGLADIDVDVTYNTIVVSARRGATLPPITTMEQVYYRSMDFTRLAQVDKLIRRIRDTGITPSTAHQMVDNIIAAPHPYPHAVATVAWGVMASGIAVLLGGHVLVGLLAFLTTVVTVTVNRRLNRIGTPVFFQQVAGGFIAVVPAAVVFGNAEALGVTIAPSQVIAAGIVVLLSGLSLVGSVQDAITGAPITGVARFFELLLMTGGIIAGVGIAIRILELTGIYLPTITTSTSFDAVEIPSRVIAGAVASCAYALASYAEKRALPVAFLGGLIGSGVVAGVTYFLQVGDVIANGTAAACVGLIGGLLARRALTPPLVVAVAGITPLLPGLAVYRGLYGILNDQTLDGFTWVAAALGVGCALAAGVTLGEFVARSLRRPQLSTRPEWLLRRRLGAREYRQRR